MKNKEKYAKEIFDVACSGDAIAFDERNNKLVPCTDFDCSQCAFYKAKNCKVGRENWSNSEYEEQTIDWSKVAVDTPILVNNEGYDSKHWLHRHFSKFENGKVYVWASGCTSWTTDGDISWEYVKLLPEKE